MGYCGWRKSHVQLRRVRDEGRASDTACRLHAPCCEGIGLMVYITARLHMVMFWESAVCYDLLVLMQ